MKFLPFFTIAMIVVLVSEIAMFVLQVFYAMKDNKDTRKKYLLSIHIGIGTTLVFWLFMMLFVGRVIDIIKGVNSDLTS